MTKNTCNHPNPETKAIKVSKDEVLIVDRCRQCGKTLKSERTKFAPLPWT